MDAVCTSLTAGPIITDVLPQLYIPSYFLIVVSEHEVYESFPCARGAIHDPHQFLENIEAQQGAG